MHDGVKREGIPTRLVLVRGWVGERPPGMAGGGGGVPLLSTTTLLLVFSISCYGQQVAPVDGSDFRTVSYEALVHNVETFTDTGISHFTEILFDVKRYQLIVGARDALFRLSLDGLQKLERTDWAATASSL